MNAIAEDLALGKYDIVCLQEVWSENDYIHIKKLTRSVLPYSHYFYRYIKKTGKNKGLNIHSWMQHLCNFVIRYYDMERAVVSKGTSYSSSTLPSYPMENFVFQY